MCTCSVQSRNLHNFKIAQQNPETVCQSRDCTLGLRNFEIVRYQCAISRSQGTGALSQDRATSVACTIEPFEFPLCTKVRNVRKELFQLRCHHQCWACILKPPHQVLLGSLPTRGNSLSLSLGTGAESSQTCGVPPFKASSSCRALNYLPLVSSDPLTTLVHYIRKLHLYNLEIVQTYCAIPRLRKRRAVSRLAAQSRDWHAISRF